MHAATLVVLIMSPINFVLVQHLVSNLGFVGAPIATSISFWCMFILLLGYTRLIKGHEAWGGWDRACLQDWGKMIRLAVPNIISMAMEWCTTELMVFFASYLGTIQVSAQYIMISVYAISCTPPWGISLAATNRIGNYLGQGLAAEAKQTANIVCILSLAYGMFATIFFGLVRSAYVPIFSGDAAVASTVAAVAPIFATIMLFMSCNNVSTGILRGLGRPDITSIIEFASYYLVGFPLSYYFSALIYSTADTAICRLWFGLCMASVLAVASHLVYIYRTDWDKAANRAQANVRASEVKLKT